MVGKRSYVDRDYIRVLNSIVNWGTEIDSRNAKTKRLMNKQITFDSTPLVVLRRTAWKNALREFEWFLSGSSDVTQLHEKVRPWWSPWADKMGFVRNNYSKQFRMFCGRKNTVDQINYMINTLKDNPNSRRNVITTWNTADMTHPDTPITNCHGTVVQAFVEPENGKHYYYKPNAVHLTMYQRSCDMVLGVPHNWIQYWAFLMYLAHQSGREVGSFTWIGGDCHIYPDHIQTVKEMSRVFGENANMNTDTMLPKYKTPNLVYNPTSDEFKADDFSLDSEYKPLIKKSLKMTV